MKISIKMTPRDRKILAAGNAVLVIWLLFALAVHPLYRAAAGMYGQARKNEIQILDMERKEAALPVLQAEFQENQKLLETLHSELLPMMQSQDIGKLLTDRAAGQGVSVRKLQIAMPEEPADIVPYLQSEEAGSNPEKKKAIYLAEVRMEVSGPEEAMDRLADEFAGQMPGVRLMALTWGKQRQEDGTGRYVYREIRVMELWVCMCGEKFSDDTRMGKEKNGVKKNQ